MTPRYLHLAAGPPDGSPRPTGDVKSTFGTRAPHAPQGSENGIFAEWCWDGKRLTVRNDRYGLFPIYYYAQDGEFAISNSIAKLLDLGAPAELDDAALAVFVRLGQFVGEDTPFAAVRAVPPGANFVWEDATLRLSSRYIQPAQLVVSRRQALDGYIGVFREAVQRCADAAGDSIVPLTGGRDSRHILFELVRSDRSPRLCVTAAYGSPYANEDVRVAQIITRALKLPHLVLQPRGDLLRAELEKNERSGCCSLEHSFALPLADYVRGSHCAVFDGIGGDVLSAGLFLEKRRHRLLVDGRWDELCCELAPAEASLKLLNTRYQRRFSMELYRERLQRELERHASAANPFTSFIFWNRTRRNIALLPFCLYQPARVYAPYLDNQVFDFLASLPPETFYDKMFHTQAIGLAFPRFRDLPYEDENARAQQSLLHFRWLALRLATYLIERPSGFLNPRFISFRLINMLLNPGFRQDHAWWFRKVVYFLSLERMLRRAA